MSLQHIAESFPFLSLPAFQNPNLAHLIEAEGTSVREMLDRLFPGAGMTVHYCDDLVGQALAEALPSISDEARAIAFARIAAQYALLRTVSRAVFNATGDRARTFRALRYAVTTRITETAELERIFFRVFREVFDHHGREDVGRAWLDYISSCNDTEDAGSVAITRSTDWIPVFSESPAPARAPASIPTPTPAPARAPLPESPLHERDYVEASPHMRGAQSGSGEIAGYHCASKPWQVSAAAMFADVPKMQRGYSVECECEFTTRQDAREAVRYIFRGCTSPCGRFVVESDGSLGVGGVEVIGAPMSLAAIQDDAGPWARMLAALRGHGARGWSIRSRAGIHVNVDLRRTTEAQRVRFFALVSGSDWSPAVAGRVALYGGAQYTKFASLEGAKFAADRKRKYAPVFFRDGDSRLPCAEVRIFGSNLAHYGFALCVEFCDAALEYCADENAVVIGAGERAAFRDFVTGDPSRAARWPRLSNRMRKAIPSTRERRDARTVA